MVSRQLFRCASGDSANIVRGAANVKAKLYAMARNLTHPAPSLTGRLPYHNVDLFHWSPSNGSSNFVDGLTDIVTWQMTAFHGLSLDDQVADPARLLAIGSILHFAQTGDNVWGSGWNGKIPEKEFTAKDLKVHAVRGPLTAEFLRKRGIVVPDVYGDPALLLPYI